MRARVRVGCAVWLSSLCAATSIATGASAVEIDWVFVTANDSCDPQMQGQNPLCLGAVAYPFQIGKHEITNAQYAEFLNAVASTSVLPPATPDPNGLYDEQMNTSPHGGITRSGNGILDDYVYTVKSGFEAKPVVFVSFYDAIRFANWLHNGQPPGTQGNSTTEDGAYAISQEGIDDNSITRKPGATVVLPSEDEWYKAAYYDPATGAYFDYPAGSNSQTTCAAPPTAANSANCADGGGPAVGTLTDAGAYASSASPFGVFDLGGNVWEWNDTILAADRTARSGSWLNDVLTLEASSRAAGPPSGAYSNQGIRVARPLPEPGGWLGIGASLATVLALSPQRARAARHP